MTTISAREFNRDVSAAKRAADLGPVVITDRGTPAYVLLAYDDYVRDLDGPSMIDLLSMGEDGADIAFEVERSQDLPREVAW